MMRSEVTTLPEMLVRQKKKSEEKRKVTGISGRSLLKSGKTRYKHITSTYANNK
jgi:DNA-binding Xre family transcriptional regulator